MGAEQCLAFTRPDGEDDDMTDDRTNERAGGNAPSPITSFFNEVSEKRNEVFRSHPGLEYEQQVRSRAVLDAVGARAGESILDIGCGNARDILPMLECGASIVGVDLSEGMLQQARRDLAAAGYHDVRLELGDATQLTFPDGTFDKVVCSETIEHIPEAEKAIGEMYRVLKPGGSLVISTPNRHSWYGFDRYVVSSGLLRRKWNHPYDNWGTMGELCQRLEKQGFQIARRGSVCYLPGFVLPYFVPSRTLQQLMVWLVRRGEPVVSRIAPSCGYTLVVTAVKAR